MPPSPPRDESELTRPRLDDRTPRRPVPPAGTPNRRPHCKPLQALAYGERIAGRKAGNTCSADVLLTLVWYCNQLREQLQSNLESEGADVHAVEQGRVLLAAAKEACLGPNPEGARLRWYKALQDLSPNPEGASATGAPRECACKCACWQCQGGFCTACMSCDCSSPHLLGHQMVLLRQYAHLLWTSCPSVRVPGQLPCTEQNRPRLWLHTPLELSEAAVLRLLAIGVPPEVTHLPTHTHHTCPHTHTTRPRHHPPGPTLLALPTSPGGRRGSG